MDCWLQTLPTNYFLQSLEWRFNSDNTFPFTCFCPRKIQLEYVACFSSILDSWQCCKNSIQAWRNVFRGRLPWVFVALWSTSVEISYFPLTLTLQTCLLDVRFWDVVLDETSNTWLCNVKLTCNDRKNFYSYMGYLAFSSFFHWWLASFNKKSLGGLPYHKTYIHLSPNNYYPCNISSYSKNKPKMSNHTSLVCVYAC